ncbi:LOW QUALITY PROTEIN: dynein beta chain, flagellar outer arm, putative [Eimeria mitis]|uniref:Dynein beta chain, flagellar outer arm, putative n=1 Tax=Eimeria mitis TaxID=44415 RepID=U6JQV8_9EIME|nr:LOW QUALITY PROTEIN: dynein beta chain, flagellar outer arm, putative [Eimeria mitis]CDJ27241.1 dynein beta chain, flagellar outer arm, putative [Eimeria mitis]
MKCPWKQSPAVRLASPTMDREGVKLSLTGDRLSHGKIHGGRSGRPSTPLPSTDPGQKQTGHSQWHDRPGGPMSLPGLHRSSPSTEMLKPSSCSQHFGLQGTKSRATIPDLEDKKQGFCLPETDLRSVGVESPEKGPVKLGFVATGKEHAGSMQSDEAVATVAVNTDFVLRPPWASVHIGSHDLSLCPPQPRRIISAAQAAAASFMGTTQRSEHRSSSLASRASVVPRRRTFTTFREWLAQDHRHSRKAWGPNGQFPARRGLSHSATTERSRILLSAAAMKRSAAESRARHAVEAEVRELSTNQTPQQQQEAYVKAQQKALALQRQQQPTVDEAVAREEARAAAAAAAAAAASAAIAQAQWPSRHKLRQQELEQMHRQEAKVKRGSASDSVSDRQQPAAGDRSPSRPRSNDTPAQEARKQKSEQIPEGRQGPSAPRKPEITPVTAAAKTKYATGKPLTLPPQCPWPTKPRPPGNSSRKRLKQLSAQERLQRSPTRKNADTNNNIDCLDGASQASGDEEDAQPFNPLDEVLVLLRKIKRAESYSFSIPRYKRSVHKGTRNDGTQQQAVHVVSAVAESVWSNSKTTESSGKILADLGPSEPEGEQRNDHQHYERNPSQHGLSRLKYLPLEAFDIPEEYGEASPEALLQRCRFECQQRRLKMRHRSKVSSAQTVNVHPTQCEAVNQICNADGCTLPENAEASATTPSEDAVELHRQQQEHDAMECASHKPKTHEEREPVGADTDNQRVASYDIQLSEQQPVSPAEAVHTDKFKIKAASPANENTECNASALVEDNIEGEAEAEVLHFVGNSWTRIPCVILRYDSDQKRFEVQLRDGTLKTVRRLALRFCFEPPQLQQQRIEICTSRRRQALTRQHFLNSVNGLPSSAFSPLPQNFINCIIKTATGIGPLRNRSVLLDSLRLAVQHLKSRFLEASKLSAVLYCAERLRVAGKLESRLLNNPFQQKQQQQQPHVNEDSQEGEEGKEQAPLLQVLQPMLPAPPPALGRLNIGATGSFEAALAPLRKKPLFANNKTFRLSLLLEGTFCDLGGLSFFDLPSRKLQRISFARVFKKSATLKVGEWTIPDPDQYLIYQQALSSDVADALRELGRDSLCHALINAFGPLHTAAATTYAAASAGAVAASATASSPTSTSMTTALPDVFLRRQLIRFNAMLRSNLLSFVIESANEWKHYMLRAVEERLDPDVQKGAAAAPDAAVAAGFSLKGNVPCFLKLHIIISNDSPTFHPGPEKQGGRHSPSSALDNGGCDADIVPFAASSDEPLLRLSLEDPFLADAERAMVSAVQVSFAVAEELRQQLAEVAASLSAAVELPVDVNGMVDLQKLQSDLQGYKDAEDRLQRLSPRIAARIFFVDGEKARAMLRSKAQRLKEQICNKALAWAESEINDLHEAWAEALAKASLVPTNEQELIELKKYLAVVHQDTAPLITRGQRLANLIALLEEHFVFASLRVQKQAFELDCCPMRLKMALCETNGILDLAKERLEARRQVSAQHLQLESEELRVEVDTAATMFKHVEESAEYLPVLEKLSQRVQAARLEVDNLRKAEGLFGLEASEFEELEGVCVVFDRLNDLWTAASNFIKSREEWQAASLSHLDCDEVEEKLQQWRQVASSTRRVAGVFRSVEPLQACDKLLQAIASFQKMLPLMKTLTHPSFQAKHWQELAARLNVEASGEEQAISLNTLLQKGLPEATQAVEVIGSSAMREFRTKACFQKMRGAWRALRMELVNLGNEALGRKMLKGFDAVNSLIEEHQASVQSLQASQLVGGVEVQAREWLRKLSDLETLCSLLEACQVSWVYLTPIFDYPEMQQQLAKEAQLLSAVGILWKEEVIGRLDDNANLLDLVELEELPQKLRSACSDMQLVVRGLNDFLEKKRLAFPRFFFLSNEELVQLLAGASHAEALAPHVQKCFEGIHSLNFDKDTKEANTIFSHREEALPLLASVRLVKDGQSASIEDIFLSIEREMCAALQQAMQKAWEEFPSAPSRLVWTTEICACAQAALAIAHCCWTAQVETAILQHQLPHLVKDLQHQLQQVVQAVRGPLSPMSRSALATLLTLDVHCRDVTEELVQAKTTHITQFEWISHLRSYWTPAAHQLGGGAGSAGFLVGGRGPNKGVARGNFGSLQLSMVESCLCYGFELLRSPDRLVVTPLTDRCYRTLMTALHFQYGGAPEGPAGTGKTETTKDLAKAAGKPCLVFNCSEGLDAAAMAALLKGLAASGGWCCFDEFNRLQLDVLSIVALQISAIQQAIRRKAITFVFEDTDLQLNPTCAINITMNPGYAGRSILPDTLKALFRPCTMMVPDAALIAEVMLYCSGFQDAFKLSKKVSKYSSRGSAHP